MAWHCTARPLLGGKRPAFRLMMRPVSIARLHGETLLVHGQLDLAKFREVDRHIRHVAQTVLTAQFLFEDGEHIIDGLLLRDLEESPAGLAAHARESFSAASAAHAAE